MKTRVAIRSEVPADIDAIADVVAAAFKRDVEARLVALLRSRGESVISLVAVVDERIAGHVLASPIAVMPGARGRYLGIAPLSVHPDVQRGGIGGELMEAVIAQAKARGVDALFLLGSPAYYPRFGFRPSHLRNDYGATDAFMQLELRANCLSGVDGKAQYADAFGEVGA